MDKYSNHPNNAATMFNLYEILAILGKHILQIVLSGVIVALALADFSAYFVEPSYESTTKIYVLNRQNTENLTTSDISVSSSLTKDYAEMITSRNVTEPVISRLGLNLSHDDFLNKVTVGTGSSSDSRILSITVKDHDPYVAQKIVSTLRDVAADHIEEVMDMDVVNIVEDAKIPDKRSSPDYIKDAGIGFAIGVFLAILILAIIYLTNDTIRTQEDVERYLGLSLLGTVPISSKDKQRKDKRKLRKRNRVKK